MTTCECKFCERIRRVRKAMAGMTPSQIDLVTGLLDDLCEAETDADVWRCRALGQWTGWEHNHAPSKKIPK